MDSIKKRIVFLVLLPSLTYGGVFDSLIKKSIEEMTGNFSIDSLVQLKCDDLNTNMGDINFSIAGCKFRISSRKCYSQTIDSVKKILMLNNKSFRRDHVCQTILAEEKEYLSGVDVYSPSSYIRIENFPENIEDADEIIDKSSEALVSSHYLSPRNAVASRKTMLEEAEKSCLLSSDAQTCAFKKSLEMSKKDNEEFLNNSDKNFSLFLREKYIATSANGDVFDINSEILETLPIERKENYLTSSNKMMHVESSTKTSLTEAYDTEELFLVKYQELIARSVTLSQRTSAKIQSQKATQYWSIP